MSNSIHKNEDGERSGLTHISEPVFSVMSKIKPMTDEAYEKEMQRREKERRQQITNDLRLNWGAPPHHLKVKVNPSGEWGKAREQLLSGIGKGMFISLVGNRGTGKTQLAVEAMIESTRQGRSALFCTALDFFIELRTTYSPNSEIKEADVLAKYKRHKLLVIDEVGKRGEKEWENNMLFNVINHRYNHDYDTVLIGNRDRAELTSVIGESLVERMNERGGFMECNWKSYR